MTKWQEIKDYVNSHELFTRKEMKKIGLGTTGDMYINNLRNAGFVIRIGRGQYKRIIKIPNYISSSLMVDIAYSEDRRKKFMMTLIRKQKLENIRFKI